MPSEQVLSVIPPAGAQDSQPFFLGDTLNPLAFNLPMTAREVKEKRSERSGVFDVGGGKFAAVSTGEPLFTPDENGKLVPVENDGKKMNESFVFDRLKNHVHVVFDLTHPRYTLSQDGYSYTITYDSDAKGNIEDDHTVAYTLGDGVTLRWTVEGDHVKKTITIEKAGTLPDLSFIFTTSDNLTQELKDNRFSLADATTQKIIFITAQPFLTDEKGVKIARAVTLMQKGLQRYEYHYDHRNLPYPYVLDPSSGPNSPSTVVNATYGGFAWSNPNNARASDNAYATSTDPTETSDYLKATGFGFLISASSTVSGIVVEIEKHNPGPDVNDSVVQLVKNGVVSGTNKADPGIWSATDAYTTYGTSSDVWGVSLSPADVNNATFGVVLAVNPAGNTCFVDHIRMTVYYTASTAVSDIPWWTIFAGITIALPLCYLVKKKKNILTSLAV